MYDSSSQYNFTGREEQVGQQAAQLYFVKWMRDHRMIGFEDGSYWLPAN